jgi:5-methylcytosine-specific restriction endonuclease McrA
VFSIPQKRCCTCKQDKSLNNFHRDSSRGDGRSPRCKACVAEYHRANRETFVTRTRAWQQANAEATRKHQREYVRKRSEKNGKTYQQKQFIVNKRVRNIEKERERRRRLRGTLRWRILDHMRCHRYRARKRGAKGSYTFDEWIALCEWFGNVCLACGQEKPLTVDHVIPLSVGGSNNISNLQPLCFSCNSRKKDKTIDYRDLTLLRQFLESML